MGRTMLLAVLIFSSCAPGAVQPVPPASPPDLPIIQGTGYVGVILPEAMADQAVRSLGVRASRFWTPRPQDVVQAESRLLPALERALAAPEVLDAYSGTSPERRAWMSRTIPKLLEHLGQYRRQYIGVVAPDGTRNLLINCFPGQDEAPDEFHTGWRQGVVAAEDGWYLYWRIQYNLSTDRFMELDPNGG